jgi:hypothetical protein
MAYYAVVDDYRAGMPQTALATPLRPRGIACHTTEGAEGEQGALGTIQFLIDRADRNASYHEIWYAKGDGFEARRIVRLDRAAHSMSPAQPPWNPNDRVRRILGDRWYDPNAYSYAVSIAGTTAVTVPNLVNDPGFMAGAARRIAEIRAAFPSLSADPMFNHGEGQADRSDWGPLMRPAILAIPLPGGDMPVLTKPVREKWKVPAGMSFYVGGPGVGELKQFTEATELWSNGETLDGRWRRLEYHDSPDIGEELWADGYRTTRKMQPIAGTRNPATGYGSPTFGVADCSAQDAKLTEARLGVAALRTQHGEEGAAIGGVAKALG